MSNKERVIVGPLFCYPFQLPKLLEDHWEELLLQYIGVVTASICGILLALLIPLAGFCLCCCRCAGKCGAYPEHFNNFSYFLSFSASQIIRRPLGRIVTAIHRCSHSINMRDFISIAHTASRILPMLLPVRRKMWSLPRTFR